MNKNKCPLCGNLFNTPKDIISTLCAGCNVKQWAWNENHRYDLDTRRLPIRHDTIIKPIKAIKNAQL